MKQRLGGPNSRRFAQQLAVFAAGVLACEPLQLGSNGLLESSPAAGGGGAGATGGANSTGEASPPAGGAAAEVRTTTGGASTVDATASSTAAGGASSEAGGTTAASGAGAEAGGTGGTAASSSTTSACVMGELAIRGRITQVDSRPVSDVTVSLSGAVNRVTTTDSDGRYAFTELCRGNYQVTPQSASLKFCTENATFSELLESADEDFMASSEGCAKADYSPRVYVVAFDPWVPGEGTEAVRLSRRYGWHDPSAMAQRFRRAVESITMGHVKYEIADTLILNEFPVKIEGGLRYDADTYDECMRDHSTCLEPDTADYQAIIADHHFCEVANGSSYDEMWFVGAPYFGFPAIARVGSAVYDSHPAPVIAGTCDRVTNVTGFNFERDLWDMLRVFHKRAEETLAFGLGGLSSDSMQTRIDQFALVASAAPTYQMSGCGSAYIPLNTDTMDDYGNTNSVPSFCDDYLLPSPSHALGAEPVPTNCTSWGCTALGYHRYVLSRFPAARGLASDGTAKDFYRYVVSNELLTTTPAVTCSSTLVDGWCARVSDSLHGNCGADEWAMAARSTGWVEFAYDAPKTVQSVTLYDRACDGRVLSGHLEFSDGSTPLGFGPLEDLGVEGEAVTFQPKQLTWLRVVIDESSGGPHVGLGEVVVE